MAEIRMSDILGRQANGPIYGSQAVSFFHHFDDDPEGTKAEGRYRCKEIEMIEVRGPNGQRTCVQVNNRHRQDYAGVYNAWKETEGPAVAGFPIFQWPLIQRMAVIELAHYKYKTLEQLAEATDEERMKLGSLSIWCDRAKDYLAALKEPKTASVRIKEENKILQRKLDKAEEQIALLLMRVSASEGIRLENVTA